MPSLRLTSSATAGPSEARRTGSTVRAHRAVAPIAGPLRLRAARAPGSSPSPAGRRAAPLTTTSAVPASDEEAPSKIESVTSETLEVALQARDTPLLIDFYATWCGPCLLMARELEKVAEELGGAVRIVKLDVDANPDIATQLRIEGLPTLVFVGTDPNKPALRTEGLLPSNVIKDIIRNELS